MQKCVSQFVPRCLSPFYPSIIVKPWPWGWDHIGACSTIFSDIYHKRHQLEGLTKNCQPRWLASRGLSLSEFFSGTDRPTNQPTDWHIEDLCQSLKTNANLWLLKIHYFLNIHNTNIQQWLNKLKFAKVGSHLHHLMDDYNKINKISVLRIRNSLENRKINFCFASHGFCEDAFTQAYWLFLTFHHYLFF